MIYLLLLVLLCGCSRPRPAPSGVAVSASAITFEERGSASGIDFRLGHDQRQPLGIRETNGHPAALLDADGDGRLDVLLAGPDRVALFRNQGRWRFQEVSHAGFHQRGYWQGVAVGDIDNDGHPDIALTGWDCLALYRNLGGGRFAAVTNDPRQRVRTSDQRRTTNDAGRRTDPTDPSDPTDRSASSPSHRHTLAPSHRRSSRRRVVRPWFTSAAFADIDRDGRLDLYVGAYVSLAGRSGVCEAAPGVETACGPLDFPAQRGRLWRNLGGGRFRDVTTAMGLDRAHGRTLGVVFADVDDDGWPDLYLANDKMAGDLFLNQKGRRFVERGTEAGVAYGPDGFAQGGMGVDFGDDDGDGRLDLVVTTFQREPTSLYRRDARTAIGLGSLLFTNAAYTSRIGPPTTNRVGYGVKWADFDNDGHLDLAIANGHPLHRVREIDPNATYAQPFQLFRNDGEGGYTELLAVGAGLPRPIVGRALCTGDLDNDGRVDLLLSDIEGRPLLLRNIGATKRHWIALRLESRSPIEGARVTARRDARRWTRWCSTGGSYLAAHDRRVHIGLGDVDRLDEIEVRWPDGARTRITEVAVDREIRVRR